MAAYKKSIDPLSISNIGLQYKDGGLRVHFNSQLLLGPIGLALNNLSFDINIGSKGSNLQDISFSNFSVSMGGLAMAFDRDPIEISGLFTRSESAEAETYKGGVIIGFEPYRFMAPGPYSKSEGENQFTSVFVFAKLEGPLIVLEFAEISGLWLQYRPRLPHGRGGSQFSVPGTRYLPRADDRAVTHGGSEVPRNFSRILLGSRRPQDHRIPSTLYLIPWSLFSGTRT